MRGIEAVKDSPINDRDTVTKRKLSLVFKYDKSGIISIKKAEVVITETVEEKPKKKDSSSSDTDKPKTKEKSVRVVFYISIAFI